MDMIQINALKHFLTNGVVQVNFEKVDGTLRRMNCTLVTEYMKVLEDVESSSKKRASNSSVASVWDLDKNDWRSFRYDSVKSVIVEGKEVKYG